ncbi:hypothetical protein [Streptomyces sp. SID3212]|uniref:hypothetical protein n=1 Tax=Streptomyces sp. SID3212 TaxID=2690259 RepID=UPI00136D4C94|nr:hypothetical protein [Streptomyces sp. SID3212]MYV56467.1 hypothetical protein [Streptomyces sp. SID3212]
MPEFVRGFRLHHHGVLYHGAQFPSGRVIAVDDTQVFAHATGAVSVEELLRGGFHDARIEWADDPAPDGG